MAKNLDLTDINVITQIISDIEGGEERNRKTEAFDSWQVYSGNVYPYVKDEIISTRPKSWVGYTISDISFSKMIVDTKAKSYKEQPLRKIAGEDKAKTERYHEIMAEGDAKRQMPYFDTVMELHKHGLFWVNNRDSDNKYQFMSLQKFENSIVRDKDTGELLAVILNYGNRDITANAHSGDGIDNLIAESQADSSAQSKIYAMWSRDNYVVIKVEYEKVQTMTGEKIKKSITYVPIPDNPKMENKIGIIPFVYVSKEMVMDYPTTSPLAQQTINANVLMSEYLSASKIQGVGQLVVKYPERMENRFKKLTTGLLSAIKLPQSKNPEDAKTEADYISPSPDLEGQRSAVITYIKQMLNEHGIKNTSSVESNGQDFSSGIQMAIANSSVQDIIEQNQLAYVEMEKQIFEIVKKWEEFRGNSVFSEDDEIQVIFKKPKVMISDAEVLANIEKRMALGLLEEYEALMILDPNLSADEAKARAKEIKQNRVKNIQGLNFGNRQDNEEN